VDNMLAITNDGRKAALDMRLVDATSMPDDASKVSQAARTIHRIWADGHEQRLTQAVFCDLSTPHTDRFNVYDELRTKLLVAGIPEQDIAYIHHADTDQKKQVLFDGVNAGRIRILLGSPRHRATGWPHSSPGQWQPAGQHLPLRHGRLV